MAHQLHHLHLAVHLGQVHGVQLGLVDDLDCNLEYGQSGLIQILISFLVIYCKISPPSIAIHMDKSVKLKAQDQFQWILVVQGSYLKD